MVNLILTPLKSFGFFLQKQEFTDARFARHLLLNGVLVKITGGGGVQLRGTHHYQKYNNSIL